MILIKIFDLNVLPKNLSDNVTPILLLFLSSAISQAAEWIQSQYFIPGDE